MPALLLCDCFIIIISSTVDAEKDVKGVTGDCGRPLKLSCGGDSGRSTGGRGAA